MQKRFDLVGAIQKLIVQRFKAEFDDWSVEITPETGEIRADNPNGNIYVMFERLSVRDNNDVAMHRNIDITYTVTICGRNNFLSSALTYFTSNIIYNYMSKELRIDELGLYVGISVGDIIYNDLLEGELWIYDCPLLAKLVLTPSTLLLIG